VVVLVEWVTVVVLDRQLVLEWETAVVLDNKFVLKRVILAVLEHCLHEKNLKQTRIIYNPFITAIARFNF
jgi:hypothetical protein